MDNTNYINAEIYIIEEDINKNIRIINSFKNSRKEIDGVKENEKEIERCEIKINGESIPF